MDKFVLTLRLFKYFGQQSRRLISKKVRMKNEHTKNFKNISD